LRQQELEEQEAGQKRKKAKKDFESWLRNEEATIHEKFERQIAALLRTPFWHYCLLGGVTTSLILVFFTVISEVTGILDNIFSGFPEIIMSIVFFGLILGYIFRWASEDQRWRSKKYMSLESQRDEELAAARASE